MNRIILGICIILSCNFVNASEPANGNFMATVECDAFLSMVKGTNPGRIKSIPGTSYEIKETNKRNESEWVRVEIPGITSPLRWIPIECGVADFDKNPQATNNNEGRENLAGSCPKAPDQFDSLVLAISWQPGFCEHPPHPAKPECAAMNTGDLVVANLTLHGLWPNKKECGTKYGNCTNNTSFELSEDTVTLISPWMPNFYYDTAFGEYEWNKHGTCQTALTPDAYFRTAVKAVQLIDASPLGNLIKNSIGKQISKSELVNAIKTFNPNAVDSFAFYCDKKYLRNL